MKKIKLKGKLSLNKETIAKLNDEQMGNVIGGDVFTSIFACKKSKDCTTLFTDQAVSCISCTGDLCNTCNGC